MAKAQKQAFDAVTDDFINAAGQNDVDLLNELAAAHPYLVDPAHPHQLHALHMACGSCQADTARVLAEKYGADVNAVPDKDRGMTALHEALNACDMVIARMLIKNGANVNAVVQSTEDFTPGWTPLHFAVSGNNADMARFLIKQGANSRLSDATGLTVAEFARHEGRNDMAELVDQLNTPPVSKTSTSFKSKAGAPKS
jgi:ankyrin repeat protein